MTGVGTPSCNLKDANCTLPLPSSVPAAAQHDELWIIKDKAADPVVGAHGRRSWDAAGRTSLLDAHLGNFVDWERKGSWSSQPIALAKAHPSPSA